MSSLSWLDTSSRDHRRALEAIRLLAEPTTVDELGVGTVRDSFADQLFPGTSTVQTRTRYFLFIPWIYMRVERSTRSGGAAKVARAMALNLIRAIGNVEGNIGRDAQERLRRLPSTIYWQGLGRLGIRRFPGSVDRFHRLLDGGVRPERALLDDSKEPVFGGYEGHWHGALPPIPSGFPTGADFDLPRAEAAFLVERIVTSAPESAFAHWVQSREPHLDAELPWLSACARTLSPRPRNLLDHARCFSELMHGAALLYNLMLAQKRDEADWIEAYREGLSDWAAEMSRRRTAHESWNFGEFWRHVAQGNPRVPARTRVFVESWRAIAMESPNAVARTERARKLISERESTLKGPLARLRSARQLELWRGSSGTRQMDYRWTRPVRTMIGEIRSGLES